MKQVTLDNYRYFQERQIAPLAPLTLLVGDNSTGNTSFLVMILALRRHEKTIHQSTCRIQKFAPTPTNFGTLPLINMCELLTTNV